MTSYGYPGVRSTVLDGQPYLCVSHKTEKNTVQPLRLAAGLVAGPLVVYASRQLPADRPVLRTATLVTGLAISYWSLWIWSKADKAMSEAP